jgi:hypothetical protein
MKTSVLFICLALIFSGKQVFAQLSKEEKKEWKKRAKELTPENLKSFMAQKEEAENTVAAQKAQIAQLQSSLSDKDVKIGELESQLIKMRGQLAAAQTELDQVKAAPPINPMDFSKGVVFKVQVGAFKNKDLSKYFDNNPNFGGEAGGDEPQKVTIGIFRDYWEADVFKKYMRDMGVKDAWIVPYKDGQRVEIKDVLEGVVADKSEEK